MSFIYSRQEVEFGKEAVDFAAKSGFIIFGKGINAYKGKLMLLDNNNAVYTLDDGNVEYVSNFDEFLGLDESVKPVEYTECRLGGKFVPVGIMLGYYYGLSALIKMLGARVRQVPVGTRANVGVSEWSMVFEDYTLVFNRDDVVALPCADDGRRSRKCPHDTPTTYAVTGSYRISDRHSLCYIGNIKFIIKYKKK
jgi:hypothetical protein